MTKRVQLYLAFAIALSARCAFSRTLLVDKSGLGQYTTIQAGINAALAGDTVKVDPGVYNEQLNISTNIVVEGSGYEYTQIVANTDPAVSMSAGTIMWFGISSNTGRGVTMAGGTLTNCVVWNCPNTGVEITGGTTAIIQNCDIINNGEQQTGQIVCDDNTHSSVINTIIWTPPSGSHYDGVWQGQNFASELYCRVNQDQNYGTGNVTSSPQFTSSTDFMLSGGSPCINTGKPDIYDPDGTRSSMGYYGGPNAPVFPVVTNLRIYLNPDGTVNVQATAQSRY